ncbi:MBL fold metallo-hydrolase [Microbacterium sp. zg.Y909]|uniref:MBL fold metallo-hydrolase n=1 Tax=Microbacterium sp. zg.Y909 TaxID=2969413 RepID=UPI00214B18EE|nr:MBL fold metallo-hydrolase [Microbacterium sp. zg.Y909]
MCENEGEPVEVLPGIWRVEAEMVSRPYRITTNAYLLMGDDDALAVDTAWWNDVPTRHVDALAALAEAASAPLGGIFLTHAHRDHSGFAEHLSERGGDPLPVSLHRDEQPTVAAMSNYQGLPHRQAAIDWYCGFGFPAHTAAMIVDTKQPDHPLVARVMRWCEDDAVLEVGRRRLRVLPTPGHTPGHAALFEEATGVLFSGDAMLPRGNGNPHVTVRPFTAHDPLTDYVEGLRRLRDLDIRVCLPGHGPLVEDVDGLIRSHLDYVDTKMTPVRAALGDRPLTVYEIAGTIPWRGGRKSFADLVNDEWFLAFGDTLARVRRAVSLGWAVEEPRGDGVPTFRAA